MTTPEAPKASLSFQSLGTPDFILDALNRKKISEPTPVQAGAIPPALKGLDILATAQTGTGKTIAYLIPLLVALTNNSRECALILAPTRELATQIKESIRDLVGRLPQFNTACLIGGEPIYKQFTALKRNPRIIIGTPGRINDHLVRGTLRLQDARYLVLDEADRMIDMGFIDDLEIILRHLPSPRQTLMFSATIPPSIARLSQKYLSNPERISIGSTTQPSAQIKQETIQATTSDKFSHLQRELEVRDGSVIIFVKTKISADKLSIKLKGQGHNVDAIHGDRNQRQRDNVIRAFRSNDIRILVATDIAARGLDVPHVKHVINYDLPQCPEDYIHRIGRTGRAGMEGHALSLISPEDKSKWRAIHRLIYSEGESAKSSGSGYKDSPKKGDRFKYSDSPRKKRYGSSSHKAKGKANESRTGTNTTTYTPPPHKAKRPPRVRKFEERV